MNEGKATTYDIHSILTEMRDEYWQGLVEVAEEQEEQLECITFTLGGEIYAFETSYATEVIRVPKLVRIPQVQETIVGIFNLRGEIVAAMDIRKLLGVPAEPLGSKARIVVLRTGNFTTGIITEEVKGVMSLPYSRFESVVRSVDAGAREYIRGQLNLDGGMVVLLDIVRLLESPAIMVDHS
jgi:purine-binding chemotaxis protein CheW